VEAYLEGPCSEAIPKSVRFDIEVCGTEVIKMENKEDLIYPKIVGKEGDMVVKIAELRTYFSVNSSACPMNITITNSTIAPNKSEAATWLGFVVFDN